jgi:hypothetical protein
LVTSRKKATEEATTYNAPSQVSSSTHDELSSHLGNRLAVDYNGGIEKERYPIYCTYLVRGGVYNGLALLAG